MKRKRWKETPVTLELWLQNGMVNSGDVKFKNGRVVAGKRCKGEFYPRVSVGRTDSKRRLGFAVTMTADSELILFTLDRAQVENLRDYLTDQLDRLRSKGHAPIDDFTDEDIERALYGRRRR